MTALLDVRDLRVRVGAVEAVRGLSFRLAPASRTGLIGESGSGKTLTALAVMGLLPEGLSASGEVRFHGKDLLAMDERGLCRLRGDKLAMIFQEPLSALDPLMRVGDQVAEPLTQHRGLPRRRALAEARALLDRVRMPDAAEKLRAYPHQLSGGQRQRVMIAAALACGPELIIADEPTTALDVTVQAEILRLLDDVVTAGRAALLLITHDLAVVSEACRDVMVMYGGHVVEAGAVEHVFRRPRHPYTLGLLRAIPPIESDLPDRRLPAIPGSVPGLGAFPDGCPFRGRCPRASDRCRRMPELAPSDDGHLTACWHPV